MPEPITLTIAILIGVTAALAVTVWHKILGWAEEILFPWMEKHLPTVAPWVRKAFIALDNVAVPLRSAARKAWKHVREALLGQIAEFARISQNEWVRRIVTWVTKTLPSGDLQPTKVVVEQEVVWDELPSEVREAFLRHQRKSVEIDIVKMRETELALTH